MKVIKRDKSQEDFDITKIIKVLQKANEKSEEEKRVDFETIKNIANQLSKKIKNEKIKKSSDIEKLLETTLIENNLVELTRNYMIGCYEKKNIYHKQDLDDSILGIIDNKNEEVTRENANKNCTILSTQRDLIAGEYSKDLVKRLFFDKDIVEAHEQGIIHIHDSDYIGLRQTNCCLINLKDMFENGTVISDVQIDTPKSLRTAATVMTQISAAVASSQFGGQTVYLSDMAPYVEVSREKIKNDVIQELDSVGFAYDYDDVDAIAEERLKKEIKDSIQTMNYQWSTLSSTNGQTPFVTLFIYLDDPDYADNPQIKYDTALLAEEVFKQRIKGVKNVKGQWISPTFPKIVYVLDEDNVRKGTSYYWLTELAAKCTAKRMVPDYVSAKVMKEQKGDVYGPMGCRSFLTPDPENHQYKSRFNQGVVTLNLPDIALSSKGDIEDFWKIFEERMKLVKKALMSRHNRLKGTKSDVAPILWQHGAYARLEPGEKIDELLYNNFSTISIGYAGLYETVKYMTGLSHTDDSAKDFALQIMNFLNDKANKWREETNISFSVYGTPQHSRGAFTVM